MTKIYCSMTDCKYNTGAGEGKENFNCMLTDVALFMNPNTKRPECNDYETEEK